MKIRLNKPAVYNIIAVIILFAILASVFFVSRNTLQKKQTNILTLNRDVVVSEIENEFEHIENAINSVDHYIAINHSLDGLLEYLEQVAIEYDLASAAYFGKADLTPLIVYPTTYDDIIPDGWDFSQRPWYQKAVEENELVFTDAFLDVSEQKYIVTGAKPVYLEGDLLGVIGIDVDLSSLSSYIKEDIPEIGGYSFLLDGSSNVVAYKGETIDYSVLRNASEFDLPVDGFSEDVGLVSNVEICDVKGYIAYSSIKDTDIVYGVFMPDYEANQSTRLFSIIGILILVSILFIIFTIYYVYNRFVQRPLDSLIEDIGYIKKDDKYSFRFIEDKDKGFIEARVALNSVLKDTHDYKRAAEKNLSDLKLRNQKYNLLLDSASDIVFQMDKSLKYTEVYGKGLKTLKRTEKDFIGHTFLEVFGEDLNESREQSVYLVLNGKKSVYSWECVVDKDVVYLETSLSPLYDLDDEIIGLVGVTRDTTEQEMRYQDMVNITNHDYLTGLRNRRFYIERLEILDTMKDYPFGIVNMDVNGLKIINDAYGHTIGDEALIKTAEVLKEVCKSNYIVSRVSGDEFTVILPKSGEIETKALKAKLLKAFSNVKIMNLNLSVAIGYYIKKNSNKSIDEVRMLAENDMYRHKISERKSVKNKAISAIWKTLTDKFEEEKTHSKRVQEISTKIGEALNLDAEELRDLSTAALFHDIGKISIPDDIIRKPGPLNDKEFEIMKSHAEVGYEILRAADEYSELAVHASSHHEKWNGSGYPRGLKEEEIPFFSRIISIADAYEAMTADRPYRKALTTEYAVKEITKYAGIQFDPKLSRIFVEKVMGYEWLGNEE